MSMTYKTLCWVAKRLYNNQNATSKRMLSTFDSLPLSLPSSLRGVDAKFLEQSKPMEDDPTIPKLEDYSPDVYISMENVIDAGHQWIAINKPPCLSLYNKGGNNKNSVQNRLINFLKRKQNFVIREQIGISKEWFENNNGYMSFPYPICNEGMSGVLIITFNPTIHELILRQYKCNEITETNMAIISCNNEKFHSSRQWKTFYSPLSYNKSNYKDIKGIYKYNDNTNDMCDVYSDWRCVATDDDYQGYALLQFKIERKVKHEIERLCSLNDTPVIGDNRYQNEQFYHPFYTYDFRERIGLHIMRLQLNMPYIQDIESISKTKSKKIKQKKNLPQNVIRPQSNIDPIPLTLGNDNDINKQIEMIPKTLDAPLPREYRNLFGKGLKLRAKKFDVVL